MRAHRSICVVANLAAVDRIGAEGQPEGIGEVSRKRRRQASEIKHTRTLVHVGEDVLAVTCDAGTLVFLYESVIPASESPSSRTTL